MTDTPKCTTCNDEKSIPLGIHTGRRKTCPDCSPIIPDYNPPAYTRTLRQDYKIAALQGIIANSGNRPMFYKEVVEIASKYADAMLAEDAEHAKKKGG